MSGTRVIVCGGVGGVGKTTLAAALGVGLALAGERVVVLTIDPARRLADALGLPELGNQPTQVALPEGGGRLDALMLDRKATWDESVRALSSSPEHAEKVLGNRYYQTMSTRLTGSHEYMATEKLYQLVSAGTWDVVVLDTPPTQHTLEFFNAPKRMSRILDGTMVRMLSSSGGGLLSGATRRVAGVIERLAGAQVLGDIREFFSLVSDLSEGFRSRSAEVHTLLHSERTEFFLVTSAAAPDRADALTFLAELERRKMRFSGFLVNRVRASPVLSRALTASDFPSAPDGVSAEEWTTLVAALGRLPELEADEARLHDQAIAELSASGRAALWTVPDLPDGIRSLDGLARMATYLPPAAPARVQQG